MNWSSLLNPQTQSGFFSLRQQSMHWFDKNGFPNSKDEHWRKIPIGPITKTNFKLTNPNEIPVSKIPAARLPGMKAIFVNGHYSPTLSTLQKIPGIEFRSMSEAFKSNDLDLQSRFEKMQPLNGFEALNTAFMSDGGWIKIKKGTKLKEPIQLVFISTFEQIPTPTATHIRNLIEAEENSEVTLLETYVGLCAGHYLTNTLTQIVAHPGASIRHYKVQKEGIDGYHIGKTEVSQGKDSKFFSGAVHLGGSIVRNDIDTLLNGEGAQCQLNGLFMASGKQVIDTHTTIDHASPNCSSKELYKGILNHQAMGIFDGRIIVRQDAQKTDSKQLNRNLLLSEDAVIDTTPRLEILADDVKCAHGATIGSLDEESIFYLRSRGIGEKEARSILTYAFAKEILNDFTFEPLKRLMDQDVLSILSGVNR